MHAVFAVIIILVAGGFLFHGIAKARAAGAPSVTASGKRGKGAGRATVRMPSARDAAKTIWTQAHATNWLEQMRHHRQNGTSPPPGKAIRAARATGRGVRKLRGAIWPAPKAQGAGGTSPPPPAAAAVTLKPPAPPAPASPGTNGTSNGRQPTMASTTSSGSAEKLVEGVNQVHNSAAAGGIFAKHGAIKAAHEGALRFADMAQMLARTLAEAHYGPEITEPLSKAGTYMRDTAQALSESDANLHSLINGSVGDHVRSGRQIPTTAELSEKGSR